jgi:hypothetical protein
MPVRLNITIDEDIYERLKRELAAKGITRFINDAIRARLERRQVHRMDSRTIDRSLWSDDHRF